MQLAVLGYNNLSNFKLTPVVITYIILNKEGDESTLIEEGTNGYHSSLQTVRI